MDRIRKSRILLAVIAVPAAAHSTFAPEDELCFASGSATYQLSQKASAPDFRIKIDNAAQRPDLRMQLVDRPEIADFVLADDYGATPGNACKSPGTGQGHQDRRRDAHTGHRRQPWRRRHDPRLQGLCAFGAILASGRRGLARRTVEDAAGPQARRAAIAPFALAHDPGNRFPLSPACANSPSTLTAVHPPG